MCLKRLKLPETIVERLIDTLPREMVPVLLWVLKRPDPWTINVEHWLQKKIISDYKVHKEIISALRGKNITTYISIYIYVLKLKINFYLF